MGAAAPSSPRSYDGTGQRPAMRVHACNLDSQLSCLNQKLNRTKQAVASPLAMLFIGVGSSAVRLIGLLHNAQFISFYP
jgi:hypothetical protein